MNLENCSKCPHVKRCEAWKTDQIKGAKTPEIGTDLEEILENYCPISSYACAMALRGSQAQEDNRYCLEVIKNKEVNYVTRNGCNPPTTG